MTEKWLAFAFATALVVLLAIAVGWTVRGWVENHALKKAWREIRDEWAKLEATTASASSLIARAERIEFPQAIGGHLVPVEPGPSVGHVPIPVTSDRRIGMPVSDAVSGARRCGACGQDDPKPGRPCPDQRQARVLIAQGWQAYPAELPAEAAL